MKMNGYPRLSEIVSGNSTSMKRTSVLNTGTINQLAAMLGCSVVVTTETAYQELGTKDSNTLYIVTNGSADTFTLYFGDKQLEGGGGGAEYLLQVIVIANVIECTAVLAEEVQEG